MNDGTLAMDQGRVSAEAAAIDGTKAYLQSTALSSVDGSTTIGANKGGQQAFEKAQTNKQSLGTAMAQEVKNIQSLGLSYAALDDMIGAQNRKQ